MLRRTISASIVSTKRSWTLSSERYVFSKIAESMRKEKTVKYEANDIAQLGRFCQAVSCIKDLDGTLEGTQGRNRLVALSSQLNSVAKDLFGQQKSLEVVLKKLESEIESSTFDSSVIKWIVADTSTSFAPSKDMVELFLRSRLLKEYLQSLAKTVQDGDLAESSVTLDKFIRVMDSFLLGTSDERILEHLRFYDDKVTQYQFQSAFHTLFDPEINTCVSSWLVQENILPKHKKWLGKFAREYLLDKIELNTKLRSVFCWVDPSFRGFIPPEDDVTRDMEVLVSGRLQYFKESSEIASRFMSDYLTSRRAALEDDKNRRENIVIGMFFVVGTGILDYIVSNL